MRKFRRFVAVGFPALGVLIVFSAILVPALSQDLALQIVVILLGLLVMKSGGWVLKAKVFANERKYLALRQEVDDFIGLIRVLNAQAISVRTSETDVNREKLRDTVEAMHAAVERMVEVAGQEG